MKKTIVLTALFAMLAMLPATVMAKGLMDALGDAGMAQGSDISMKGPTNPTTTPTLADYSGTYYMFPDNGLVLEIVNNTSHLLRQHTFKGTRNQQFRVAKQSDGTYKIFSVASGRALTSFNYTTNATHYRAVQYDDFGVRKISDRSLTLTDDVLTGFIGQSGSRDTYAAEDISQHWRIESVGNNQVKIEDANNINGCLDFGSSAVFYYQVNGYMFEMSGGGYGNLLGERITLVPVSGNTDRFIPAANGVYKIQPRYKSESGKGYLEVGGDPINGNPQLAHNFTSTGSDESNWRFERQADWTYIITHIASNRVMAVRPIIPAGTQSEATRYQSAAVVVQPRTNTTDERWYVTNSGNGFYQFTNVKTGMTYRGQQWDGAKLLPGTTDLLYGWFKLIKQ